MDDSTRNALDGQVDAHNVLQARDIRELHVHSTRAPADPRRRSGPLVVGEIPREPAGFQPRQDLRDQLEDTGDGTSVCVLIGARGVGKTQLAAAHARQCIAEGWPVVAWVDAETSGQLLAGLDLLAAELGLRGVDDDAETAAKRVRNWLQSSAPGKCLLVFDNAVDPDEVERWLPVAGPARIIITSTHRVFEELGTPIDVGVFSPAEALTLLRARTGLDDRPDAQRLAGEVGYLPLALGQAAAVIRTQRLTYDTFIERLRSFPVEEYLRRRGGGYPLGAAQALVLSLEAAESDESLVRPLAEALAVLSPAGVGRKVLHAVGRMFPHVDPATIDGVLGRLADASLLTFGVDGETVIMHRFTQRVIRDRARQYGSLPGTISAVAKRLMELRLPKDRAWSDRHEGELLIQQIDAVWSAAGPELDSTPAEERDAAFGDVFSLRLWAARQLYDTWDPTRAAQLGGQVQGDCTRLLGSEHPLTLDSRAGLARAWSRQGRLTEARELGERNLADRERIFGADHPSTCDSRGVLALTLTLMGRVAEAVRLREENLARRERILGRDHPQTLVSRNDLGVSYHRSGRMSEALSLHEHNLAERERVLGPDHPATLESRAELAGSHNALGHADEAIALHRRNLGDRERVLGTDHPSTLTTVNDLAFACSTAGLHEEAMTLHERNLATRRRLYGSDHPRTLITASNLANVYRAVGRVEESIALHEQTLAVREVVLDAHHPATMISRAGLARSYLRAGRVGEAIALHERVLAERERLLGPDNPRTLQSRAWTAQAYAIEGRLDDALAQHELNLSERRRILGTGHPETLESSADVAHVHHLRGHADQALALYAETLEVCEAALRRDHPLTLSIVETMAEIRAAQERRE